MGIALRHVLHQHHYFLHAGDKVHGAAHALHHLAGNHPVGQVALGRHLHGTEDGKVDVTTADHREGIGAIEEGAARNGGDGVLAGVDEVRIDFVVRGEGANAEQSIFALQPHVHACGNVVRHQRGQANAKVHVVAVTQFLRRTGRHLVVVPGHVRRSLPCVVQCAFLAWRSPRCASRRCLACGFGLGPVRRPAPSVPLRRCRACRPWPSSG